MIHPFKSESLLITLNSPSLLILGSLLITLKAISYFSESILNTFGFHPLPSESLLITLNDPLLLIGESADYFKGFILLIIEFTVYFKAKTLSYLSESLLITLKKLFLLMGLTSN